MFKCVGYIRRVRRRIIFAELTALLRSHVLIFEVIRMCLFEKRTKNVPCLIDVGSFLPLATFCIEHAGALQGEKSQI